MDAIAHSHAQLLSVNAALMARAVEGLSAEDVLRQPGEHGNPILWILAHAVATRGGLLAMLGATWDAPAWARTFWRGSARPPADGYPPVSEVLATLNATSEALATALAAVTDEQWSAPSTQKFPVPDRTLRGDLAFFVFHETYHVGQMAYVRRWLGHSGLVG
jgi:uncharacterized damage-inducible protein DinB